MYRPIAKTTFFELHSCRWEFNIFSTTFTQWATKATEFGEITQNKGHYAVQGHSRSPILIPIESSLYGILLVINTNLFPILHLFRDVAFDRYKIPIFDYPLLYLWLCALCFTPRTEGFPAAISVKFLANVNSRSRSRFRPIDGYISETVQDRR